MIVYSSDYFGLLTLLTLNGSAAYRAFLPALFSTLILLCYKFTWGEGEYGSTWDLTVHPYVIAIYVMAFSLVLNFRLNYSYQRYWEAASHLFMMTSKWVDAAAVLASFHYQSDIYRPYRPLTFGKRPKQEGAENWAEDEEEPDNLSTNTFPQERRRRTLTTDDSFWDPSYIASGDLATSTQSIAANGSRRDTKTNGLLNKLFKRNSMQPTTIRTIPQDLFQTSYDVDGKMANISPDANQQNPRFHRRVPSVDLPRPGTGILKSFQPTQGHDWERLARTKRLSRMPLRKPNQSLLRDTSMITDVNVDLWLSGGSADNDKGKKSRQRQKHSKPHLRQPRRMTLPAQTRRCSDDSDIDLLNTTHPDGVASEEDCRRINSGGSDVSSKDKRKRRWVMSPLMPRNWMLSGNRSGKSMDEAEIVYGERVGSDLLRDDEDDADTSSTNSSSTEQFGLLPSLFLQEAAHLFSLTSAVAMASLRADLEGCASPLVEYVPGQPFPPVNPDEMQVKVLLDSEEEERDEIVKEAKENSKSLDKSVNSHPYNFLRTGKGRRTSVPNNKNRKNWIYNNRIRNSVYFLLGISRSPRQRTLYNASRPFAVIGGLSDKEVQLLKRARGPEAQLALCTLWLKEFISREHLDGSTGKIAPPIVARVYHYISDGCTQYNQCRKTAYTQFPFVHSQLTTLFIFVSIFVFPFLYYTYVNNIIVACLLNSATVACFVGMTEVARELQDPFYQFPNDLPLNNYQVQFNETLISCLYGGFHPDAQLKNNDTRRE